MEYIIVSTNISKYSKSDGDMIESLQRKVQDKIKQGYIPQGGIVAYHEDTEIDSYSSSGALHKFKPAVNFSQAMIRMPVEPVDPKPIKRGFQ